MIDEERIALPQLTVKDILDLSGVADALALIQERIGWLRAEPMMLAMAIHLGATLGSMERLQRSHSPDNKAYADDWHERFQAFLVTARREAIAFNQTHTDQEIVELATLLDDTHDPKATKH